MEYEEKKYIKRVTSALIASALLNALLLGALCYVLLSRSHLPKSSIVHTLVPKYEVLAEEKSSSASLAEVILAFKNAPFHRLVQELCNDAMIENGYRFRDVALAYLISLHQFDLCRASGHCHSKLQLLSNNETKLSFALDLNESDYQAIARFAATEEWPFTGCRLFSLLEQKPTESLKNAFYLTREFSSISLLFAAAGAKISSDTLLQMILAGNWETLSFFAEKTPPYSAELRQEALVAYLHHKSPLAAELLLALEPLYAVKQLSNEDVLLMLSLIKTPSKAIEKYAQAILASPRPETVTLEAAKSLYAFAKEEPPSPWSLKIAKKRFLSKQEEKVSMQKPVQQLSASKQAICHKVQPGDSLWKIAKKYNVSIEKIKELNNLKSDVLLQGKALKIE
jgi:LysM repeat protein